MNDYKNKYIKYKTKYLKLKGGSRFEDEMNLDLEDLEDLETDLDKSPVFDELKALDDFDVRKIDEAEKALAEEKEKAINIEKIEKTIYKLEKEIKTYKYQIKQDNQDIQTLCAELKRIESSNMRAKNLEQRGVIGSEHYTKLHLEYQESISLYNNNIQYLTDKIFILRNLIENITDQKNTLEKLLLPHKKND